MITQSNFRGGGGGGGGGREEEWNESAVWVSPTKGGGGGGGGLRDILLGRAATIGKTRENCRLVQETKHLEE